VVVDRLVVREDIATRLADSFETALELADGLAIVEFVDKPLSKRDEPKTNPPRDGEGRAAGAGWGDSLDPAASGGRHPQPLPASGRGEEAEGEDGAALAERSGILQSKNETHERLVFSANFACPVSGFTIDEIEPRLFSFNNPYGACPACDGLGSKMMFEADLIVPERGRSLADGAILAWTRHGQMAPIYRQMLLSICTHYGVDMKTPFDRLPEHVQQVILHGSGKEKIAFAFADGLQHRQVERKFEGVVNILERRFRETDSPMIRDELSRFQSQHQCERCHGNRLREQALAVRIDGRHIGEVTRLSILDAGAWFAALPERLTPKQNEIAVRILKEIRERLRFLNDVGLEYLTLARNSGTLSGGESQRIRLASQIGSGLTGVLYVLDEPSIGLHQRDNDRLLETLRHLRDLGNTVIVVEHDEDAILTADHVVDMGPGAGVHGGEVVSEGTPKHIMADPNSLTGKYLSGELAVPVPKQRRAPDPQRMLRLVDATGNNLKRVTAEIPLGCFVCVTGVSGGGKSTLLIETLYKALARHFNNARDLPLPFARLEGLEHLDKIIDIDQSPIGRTPRSNPATYTGAFTPIREWYANLPEARGRGYQAGRFSFNVKGGRCEACQGDGVIKIEMHFLPDVYVTCDQCKGRRYNRETLEVRFKDKSIADVLDMTVEEGAEFFHAVPSIRDKLDTLKRVGLSYIHIGQQATTLSGGEAQRVKLSKELAKRATGRTLYILDEPTTGLHFHDVAKLLEVLHELVDQGNTVVVIEHNLEVIKTADWLIDLGPEGGDKGGRIVATGTPEDVAACGESYTGKYLKALLARKGGAGTGAGTGAMPEAEQAEADRPTKTARAEKAKAVKEGESGADEPSAKPAKAVKPATNGKGGKVKTGAAEQSAKAAKPTKSRKGGKAAAE
jgi:excinuclease ABC subunit A